VKKVTTNYKYILDEDLVEEGVVDIGSRELYYGDNDDRVWLVLGPGRKVTVKDNYSWDGCSPKFAKVGPFWLGTVDTKRNWKGSCVHDALYQYGLVEGFPYNKEDADVTFYNILLKYKFTLKNLYYWAVDKFGRYHKEDNVKLVKEVIL
jgi:hypothetical protein